MFLIDPLEISLDRVNHVELIFVWYLDQPRISHVMLDDDSSRACWVGAAETVARLDQDDPTRVRAHLFDPTIDRLLLLLAEWTPKIVEPLGDFSLLLGGQLANLSSKEKVMDEAEVATETHGIECRSPS